MHGLSLHGQRPGPFQSHLFRDSRHFETQGGADEVVEAVTTDAHSSTGTGIGPACAWGYPSGGSTPSEPAATHKNLPLPWSYDDTWKHIDVDLESNTK
jgi:hypothetical protein